MKQKLIYTMVTILLLGCLGGCQKPSSPPGKTDDAGSAVTTQADAFSSFQSGEDRSGSAPSPDTDPADGARLFAGCALTGTVTEFSDSGCRISPTVQDGDIAYEAAEGFEDEAKMVDVTYGPGCTFRIATANIATGELTYADAAPGDVKKQTRLVLYGEYDSENRLVADQVYLYRMIGG